MGIFSEIDMENKMRKEQEEEQSLTASELAAKRDEARQAAEAEEARKILAQMNADDASPTKEDDDDESQEEGNSPLETINPPAEDEKRKAHEEAEAKRKAEWEAKKREREEADTMAWETAIAMDDDALMEASSNRLATDAERITRRNMKQCVTEYVQALCFEDIKFAQQVMHPRKTMINCFRYINRKALEFVKKEMEDNDIKPSREGYGCDIPDDLCYQWAVDYFNDMEVPEDKKEGEEDFVPKPYTGSVPKKSAKPKQEKKAEKPKKAEPKPAEPKNEAGQSEGQLSIFNMGVA